MSNFIYGKAKEALFKGSINIVNSNCKIALIDTNHYVPMQNIHEFMSSIPSESIMIRSNALQNVSCTLGVVDADDVIIGFYDGNPFDAIIFYIDTGSDSTSRLLFYIDESPGLPFNGVDSSIPVTILWDNGINKILSI